MFFVLIKSRRTGLNRAQQAGVWKVDCDGAGFAAWTAIRCKGAVSPLLVDLYSEGFVTAAPACLNCFQNVQKECPELNRRGFAQTEESTAWSLSGSNGGHRDTEGGDCLSK